MHAEVQEELYPARWWHREEDGRILCTLCPRFCRMHDGQAGFCFIRKNEGGELKSLGYGRSTGFAVDPIEKKPLNHFYPGTPILSFGTAGCNLGCKFCQNWNISKVRIDDKRSAVAGPQDVVALAKKLGCPSIAFTYNDPVIFGEFVIDISREARAAGLHPVLVTAGYITVEARAEVYEHAEAANVDLKAFTEDFYRKVCLAHIEPVKETLRWLVHETNVWTEITTLLIPGLNDTDDEIRSECEWILKDLRDDVPVHFTAFHPDFKMLDRPHTPPATLVRARAIAREMGMKYVYVGNVHDAEGQATTCPSCGTTLIVRDWHSVRRYRLKGNRCPECDDVIPGVFDPRGGQISSGRRYMLPLV